MQRVAEIRAALPGDVEVRLTEQRGHATDIAREATAGGGIDALYMFSGDGGFNEVLNGVDGTIPVGFLPGGNTSVLSRALGLPRDPLRAANHSTRRVSPTCLCQVSTYRSYVRWSIGPAHIRLIPWRPAVIGLSGYQNGIAAWSGFVESGTVGKSWYTLPALEISPVANALQMIPSVSSKRGVDCVQLLPNHACSIGATPRPTPKSRRPP